MLLTKDKISTFFDQHADDMLSLLEKLCKLETPSRRPESQIDILKLLSKVYQTIGCKVNIIPGKRSGGMLLAYPLTRSKNKKKQLLLGHCDTVWNIGTLKEMPYMQDDYIIKGPGVYDMKAGLVQMVFAMKYMQSRGVDAPLTPICFINSDEEIGSRDSTIHIRRLAGIVSRAFVLEPPLGPDGKIKTQRKGLGRYNFEIFGRAAHAGLDPGKGVSAIEELSYQIQQLFAMNAPDRGISVNVGMIEGGISANVIAPRSSAVIDVRVLSMQDAELIDRKIRQLQPNNKECRLHISGGFGRMPMEKTARNQKLWLSAVQTAASLGMTIQEGIAGGGSDGNTTSLYTATLDGLGTVGDGAHAAHEFIWKEKLIERSILLTSLLCMPEVE